MPPMIPKLKGILHLLERKPLAHSAESVTWMILPTSADYIFEPCSKACAIPLRHRDNFRDSSGGVTMGELLSSWRGTVDRKMNRAQGRILKPKQWSIRTCVAAIAAGSSKVRYEILMPKDQDPSDPFTYHQVSAMRAIQGHSGKKVDPNTRNDLINVTHLDVPHLWHGTSEGCHDSIMEHGIVPGGVIENQEREIGRHSRRPQHVDHHSHKHHRRSDVFLTTEGWRASKVSLALRQALETDKYGYLLKFQPMSYYHPAAVHIKVDVRKCIEVYGIVFKQTASLAIITESTIPSECLVECLTKDGQSMNLRRPKRPRNAQSPDISLAPAHVRQRVSEDQAAALADGPASARANSLPTPPKPPPPPPPAAIKGFGKGGATSRGATAYATLPSAPETPVPQEWVDAG